MDFSVGMNDSVITSIRVSYSMSSTCDLNKTLNLIYAWFCITMLIQSSKWKSYNQKLISRQHDVLLGVIPYEITSSGLFIVFPILRNITYDDVPTPIFYLVIVLKNRTWYFKRVVYKRQQQLRQQQQQPQHTNYYLPRTCK